MVERESLEEGIRGQFRYYLIKMNVGVERAKNNARNWAIGFQKMCRGGKFNKGEIKIINDLVEKVAIEETLGKE